MQTTARRRHIAIVGGNGDNGSAGAAWVYPRSGGVCQTPREALAWPMITKLEPSTSSFVGRADTVLDVIGRIGALPSMVIFTEGNHLMVLSSDDIVGAFPSWARSQPQYVDLDLTNIILVTLSQPILVQMMRTGGIALDNNLTLDVSRSSGFYPDIFKDPEPLRQLRRLGALEQQARYFCKNRGVALLVQKGNPLGIHNLADVARAFRCAPSPWGLLLN